MLYKQISKELDFTKHAVQIACASSGPTLKKQHPKAQILKDIHLVEILEYTQS